VSEELLPTQRGATITGSGVAEQEFQVWIEDITQCVNDLSTGEAGGITINSIPDIRNLTLQGRSTETTNPNSDTIIHTHFENFSYETIPLGETVTVYENQEMVLVSDLTVEGDLVLEGDVAFAPESSVYSMDNIGSGVGVYKNTLGNEFRLKSFVAGLNVTLTENADDIEISSTDSGEDNTASNVGSGAGVFKQKDGVDLELRSIVGGVGITATENADDITISLTDTPFEYSFNKVVGTGTSSVTGTLAEIDWNASDDSSGSDVSYAGGNPERLTVNSDGVYKVAAFITIQSGAQRPQVAAEIFIDGTATGFQRGGSYIRNSGISYDYWTIEVASEPFSLTSGQYVSVGVGQVTGGTYGYGGTATINCDRSVSKFWVERVA